MTLFAPRNRYLLIELISDSSNESEQTVARSFILPDDESQAKKMSSFVSARLLASSPDTKIEACIGEVMVVNSGMIEKVEYQGQVYNIILENHVMGIVRN